MTALADSGVVDMSGVVGAILSSYQDVVARYQRMVTGDPGALSSAAATLADEAGSLASVSSDLTRRANILVGAWEGDAANAFRAAVTGLAGLLDRRRATAAAEGRRLDSAARLLQGATTAMDSVVSRFQSAARTLTDESRTAAASAVGAFVQAAQQLGQSAVGAARSLVEQVGQALAALWGPAPGAERDREFGGKPGQRLLANQPWFRQWYRQTYGKDPDPNNLKAGALSWMGKDGVLDGRRRSTSSPGVFTNGGWRNVDGLQRTSAPLRADTPFGSLADPPPDASLAAKTFHDTNFSLYDSGKLTLADGSVYDPKADSGNVSLGSLGAVNGRAELDVGPRATGEWNLSVHNGQASVGGDLKGTLADASASGQYTDGPVTAAANGDAMVGGDLSGHLSGGLNGIAAHVNAFAGAQVQGSVSADVGGVGVGAQASLQAGIGAQLDGQATWDAGHVKVNWKAGAALGFGAGIGGNIDVDVPKLVNTAQQYGGQVVTGVENTASQAATAIGSAFNGAGHYLGAW